MARLFAVFLSLALLSATQALAAPVEDAFERQIEASAHRLVLGPDGDLSGPGADLIAREIAGAQFFMIGEQHGTAGIGEVNLALHRHAARHGYHHAALEIGPHSARQVEQLVRRGPGSLAEFIRRPGHGFLLPFLAWAEETALAEQVVALSPAQPPVLWGIDQEFVGSAPLHLERLKVEARTDAQRRVIAQLQRRTAADPLLLATMEPADLVQLHAAFPADRHPGPAKLIEDLMASSAIYAPFLGRSGTRHAANAKRERLMKRQLLEHFSAAEARLGAPPKLFLKFGANHAMRGHSLSNVPAVGNFLAEWGLSRGFTMVNLLVDCVGGEMADLRTGKRSPCAAYIKLPSDSPMHRRGPNGELTVYDLRPLRAAMPGGIDSELKRLILAFDFYMPVHQPAAASLLTVPPPPSAK